MRVVFMDGRSLSIADEAGTALMIALATPGGAPYLKIKNGLYARSSISRVEAVTELDRYQTLELPAGSPDLSDEERARKLARLAELRRAFLKRHSL